MLKYAKIADDETKACDVGLGTNAAFYRSIGMVEMDVEQAHDGQWYLAGYAPATPNAVTNKERITELEILLEETDPIVMELLENTLMNGGNLVMPIDSDKDYATVLANRAAWRAELAELSK